MACELPADVWSPRAKKANRSFDSDFAVFVPFLLCTLWFVSSPLGSVKNSPTRSAHTEAFTVPELRPSKEVAPRPVVRVVRCLCGGTLNTRKPIHSLLKFDRLFLEQLQRELFKNRCWRLKYAVYSEEQFSYLSQKTVLCRLGGKISESEVCFTGVCFGVLFGNLRASQNCLFLCLCSPVSSDSTSDRCYNCSKYPLP